MIISVGDNIVRDVLRPHFDMMSLPMQDTRTRRNQGTARHEVRLRSKTHINQSCFVHLKTYVSYMSSLLRFQTMAVTTQLVTKIGTGVIDPAELPCCTKKICVENHQGAPEA
jgi:hypothetical protein